MNIIDKLLETPCYIMDFLPKQVPMNCGGQFFEVETYLLNHYDCCGLRDRFVGVILKASNNFKFISLSSGSFQMDRAAFAYIIPPISMRLLWLPFITSSML